MIRRAALGSLLLLGGCNGRQSTLAPFGAEAETTLTLTLVMAACAGVVALGVLALFFAALRPGRSRISQRGGTRLVLWLGAICPAVLLLALLATTLPLMKPLPVDANDLQVAAEGEQFWWRIRYRPPGGDDLVTANELRVPVGRTVAIALTAGDVIHSFWIPGLSGKMDMIPGRTNTLSVRATRAGVFRGVCTEFCGLSHALMAFDVIAMEPAAFEAWLASAKAPAPAAAAALPGRSLFVGYGCGGCHTIRGHGSAGTIGPDLTRLAERRSVAAGTLPNTVDALARFIRHPAATKPGIRMPAFPQIPLADARLIAEYLRELR